MHSKKHALVGLALAAVVALAGCGGGGNGSGSGEPAGERKSLELYGKTVSYDEAMAAKLPEDIRKAGVLKASTDAAGPPRSFIDEKGNIVGVTPDLLNAVGAMWGVKVEIQKNSFDAEVPGVESGRFDLTTGTGDFPKRREVLDLVDYLKAGYLYLVAAGNPKNVTDDPMSQCGLKVGVLKGTTQETLVTDLSKKCTDAGKPAIELQSFNNVLLPVPLQAGRVDVVWENTSTGFQVAQESPDVFEVAGKPIFAAYLAFGVKKDRPELRDTLQQSLQKLLDDGTYQAVLDHWKQGELAMDTISVNSDVRPDK